MEAIDQIDLLRLQLARERVARLDAQIAAATLNLHGLTRQKQDFQAALTQQIDTLREKYKLGETDPINLETGTITRVKKLEAVPATP